MPDVLYESARTDYDDAYEIVSDLGDGVGVATYPVDREWGGNATGTVDCLPIRVYVFDVEGHLTGEAGSGITAYLELEAARELRDALDAAIDQVELVRHGLRRQAFASAGVRR